MLKAVATVALMLAVSAPPKHYLVRVLISAPPGLSTDVQRITDALQRGLYMDSLIAPGGIPRSTPVNPGDSAAWANRQRAAAIRGLVDTSGTRLEARLTLVNVLAQPLVGPDIIRVERASLDSAFVALGRRYAARLAR